MTQRSGRIGRIGVAVLMPLGPAAVAVLRFVLPYDTGDSGPAMLAKVTARPDAQRLVLWAGMIAVFTLLPGAFAALRLARGRAPALTLVAGALLVPGYLALTTLLAADQIALDSVIHHLPPAATGTLLDVVAADPFSSIYGMVFVVGHIAGTVLLAIALRRARRVPLWGALVLGLSQPLHLLAALSGNHPLDLVGWGMTAVGMAVAAVSLVSTPSDDRDDVTSPGGRPSIPSAPARLQ